jgi:hypothetical protein
MLSVACGSGVCSVVESSTRTLSAADGRDIAEHCSAGSRWFISHYYYYLLVTLVYNTDHY